MLHAMDGLQAISMPKGSVVVPLSERLIGVELKSRPIAPTFSASAYHFQLSALRVVSFPDVFARGQSVGVRVGVSPSVWQIPKVPFRLQPRRSPARPLVRRGVPLRPLRSLHGAQPPRPQHRDLLHRSPLLGFPSLPRSWLPSGHHLPHRRLF